MALKVELPWQMRERPSTAPTVHEMSYLVFLP
jgi:hypothetical protein